MLLPEAPVPGREESAVRRNPEARAVRLGPDDWRAYDAGLRARGGRVARRLLPRVREAAAAPGGATVVLTPAEQAVLREIDEQAASALVLLHLPEPSRHA